MVPPHVFANIARNSSRVEGESDQVGKSAIEALSISNSLRSARMVRSESLPNSRNSSEFIGRSPSQFRNIYDLNHAHNLPGTLERSEGDPAVGMDPAVNDAYTNLGIVFDFYNNVFKRKSIDNMGALLNGFVHYGRRYNDAYWDGKQMIFGDGDGIFFRSFASQIDVVGHELTHGVIQHEANFIYWKQSGALNESISDVFASLIKQYKNKQTAEEASWLLGEDLLAERVRSGRPDVPAALRSMKDPGSAYNDPIFGKDPQPKTMSGYVNIPADHGGVHINSGIPNHAFYLAASNIGGYAWEQAGLIWYRSLRTRQLKRNAQFSDFAQVTVMTARRLFGFNSLESRSVRNAWQIVGVL